jgi:hypothetical protein
MTPGYSEFISSGKFSVGYYWGWYLREWVEVPGPWNEPGKKTYAWARWVDVRNPCPFYKKPLRDADFELHDKVSNTVVRSLFQELTGVRICKYDMYHGEEA